MPFTKQTTDNTQFGDEGYMGKEGSAAGHTHQDRHGVGHGTTAAGMCAWPCCDSGGCEKARRHRVMCRTFFACACDALLMLHLARYAYFQQS